MIDFEEELKKFEPIMEVEEAEDAIHSRDLTDTGNGKQLSEQIRSRYGVL